MFDWVLNVPQEKRLSKDNLKNIADFSKRNLQPNVFLSEIDDVRHAEFHKKTFPMGGYLYLENFKKNDILQNT